MAYAERRERQKGVRYRGIYKAADGRYRSAGTFSSESQALAVAEEAERTLLRWPVVRREGWIPVRARRGRSRSTHRFSSGTTRSRGTPRTLMLTRCDCM